MSLLFSSLTIKEVTFRNRIVMSPMCQYSSVDGHATDWHLVHLGSRAAGGAALIIQEATAVSPEGRISPGDMGLWSDVHIEKLRNIVSFIHQQGSVAGIQLAHAGRKGSCHEPWNGGKQVKKSDGGWQTVAPSAIPFYEHDDAPLALDEEGIKTIISDFQRAAARAVKIGYKVLEIHAAHGYLLHEFLSPLSNKRHDAYGGNFENRTRLLLEIIDAVHHVWPASLPLFVRISATDWADDGWNINESVQLASLLRTRGVDLIDCSSGGLIPGVRIPATPGYQVSFAAQIKYEAKILTGAVGLITEAHQAEEILTSQQADLIVVARQLLRDPYFPIHAAQQLHDTIVWPVQYERAK